MNDKKDAYWLLIIILLSMPLWSIVATPLKIVTAHSALGLLVVGIVFWLVVLKGIGLRLSKYSLLVSAIFLYHFVWDVFNGTFDNKGLGVYLVANRWLNIWCMFLLLANQQLNESAMQLIRKGLVLTIVLATGVSLYQVVIDNSFLLPIFKGGLGDNYEYFSEVTKYEKRFASIFGYIDPNELGMSFLPLLSVYIGWVTWSGELKVSHYLLIVGGLIVILASNTRYMQLNGLLIASQLALKSKNKLSLLALLSISCLFIYLYGDQLLSAIGFNMDTYVSERLKSDSYTSRFHAFDMLVKYFPTNPVFGTGVLLTPELAREVSDYGSSMIHVGYFSYLVSYGFVGALLMFGLWFWVAKDLWKMARATNYYGSFLAFICFLTTNATLVDYSFFRYGMFIAFMVGVHIMQKQIHSRLSPPTRPQPKHLDVFQPLPN
jgi:O-Antigen ligase